jgi:hypothetical protein
MGMEQFLLSFPKIIAVISPGSYAQVQRIASGPFQIVMRGDSIAADFMAGAFEGAARLTSIPIRIEVIRREPEYEWVVEALTPKHLSEHWTRRLIRRDNPEPTPAIDLC